MTSAQRTAFDDAVSLLARRSHCQKELSTKLIRKGHSASDITSAFERLNELGYLEAEDELAIRFAHELARKRGATPRRTAYKLQERGFEEHHTQQAIEAAFQNWNPQVAALETVEGVTDPMKAARRLTSRGFPSDAIAWVVSRLKREADHREENSE